MTDPNQPASDPNNGVPPQQPYGSVPPQQPQQPYAAAAPAAPLDQAQDKQWASFAHLGGILWILPSLIIYLVFKDRGALTRQESKEALNWQITWLIVWFVSVMISVFLVLTPVGFIFSLLIPWALYIVNLVFSILGFVKVNSGGTYRYPVNFRFIK
ncbi:DUF4870 domain-containing protein [Leifsonia sp. NPDC058230]|uniref:DUF4870 domain-containing protein n=1 Tax=Leifsonia sp. NPDC058230 TaxID=3346391 RepID=UPI0036DA8FBE